MCGVPGRSWSRPVPPWPGIYRSRAHPESVPTLAPVPVVALVLALLSATAAAISTSLQHQAAELAPAHVRGTWELIRHLVQRPRWLLGQACGVVTVVFHAVALNFGPITLVQPLVVSGIVLAVPLRAGLARRLPGRREMG